MHCVCLFHTLFCWMHDCDIFVSASVFLTLSAGLYLCQLHITFSEWPLAYVYDPGYHLHTCMYLRLSSGCILYSTLRTVNVYNPSIHRSMGSSPAGVQSSAHLTIFYASLSWAFLFRICISYLHHAFTSSSHSLLGLPLLVFPSIFPNTTSFSLLFSILPMCPNMFNVLSLIS